MFQFFPVFFISTFCKVNSAAKHRDVESDLCSKVSTGGYQSGDPGESMCRTSKKREENGKMVTILCDHEDVVEFFEQVGAIFHPS